MITTDYGTTFQNLEVDKAVEKLQELKRRRRDIITPIESLRMTNQGGMILENGRINPILAMPNEVGHEHISSKMAIPRKYWQTMFQKMPELAATNFNKWVEYEHKQAIESGKATRKMFFRSYMDEPGGNIGTMRALLSNSYLPYDNLSLLAVVFHTCMRIKNQRGLNIEVDKCDLSDKRIFVRFICRDIEQQIKDQLLGYRDPNQGTTGGDQVSKNIFTGFVISNSEVGYGKLSCAPRMVVGACSNGMVFKDESYDRRHLGGKMDEGTYSERTHKTNFKLIQDQLTDHITKYLSEDFLAKTVDQVKEMAARKLEYPFECVQNMAHELSLSDEETSGMINHFITQGRSQNLFDISQAITSFAQICNPEQRFSLEEKSTDLMKIVDKCDRALVLN